MTIRTTAILFLLLTAGCFFTPATPPKATAKKRPDFTPVTLQDGRFTGQTNIYTSGTQGDALGCDLSPRGDLIVFSSNNDDKHPKLYFMQTKGKQRPVQLTFGGWTDMQPEFLPSSSPGQPEKIAYSTNKNGNFDILLASLSGTGGAYQLIATKADEIHPSFSPDGKFLAFSRLDRSGTWLIWILDLTTQRQKVLGAGKNPEWSPAGDKIAFQLPVGREKQTWSIWIMNTDGSNRTQIESSAEYGAITPSWSPDGRYLVYTRIPLDAGTPPAGDIWAEEIATGADLQLTSSRSMDTDPCWSLDGLIYFSSTRATGRFNILSGEFDPELLNSPRLKK